MTDPVIDTLVRRIEKHFTREDKSDGCSAFRHHFSRTPGRSYTNKYGVSASLLVVHQPSEMSRHQHGVLILHSKVPRVLGHQSEGEEDETGYIRAKNNDLRELLRSMLQRFQTITMCSGCTKLIRDDEKLCVDCELLTSRGREEEMCAICQESTALYATLPCGHHYHVQCVAVMKGSGCDCEEEEEDEGLKCPQCRRRRFSLPLVD